MEITFTSIDDLEVRSQVTHDDCYYRVDEQLQWDYDEEIDQMVWKYTLVYLGTIEEVDRLEKEFAASGESHIPF